MKRILITGQNSYIGTQVERFLKSYGDAYQIETLDMHGAAWLDYDFTGFDVVFHVAGIAHSDRGRISAEQKDAYDKVNFALTRDTAQKAKEAGVCQFIFMSSIIVYGESSRMGKDKRITRETKTAPANAYGMSKLNAETAIRQMCTEAFRVCIIRPPMIYGPGCKGNYPVLRKLALRLPIFPDIKNERSMLFIDHLTRFVKYLIDDEKQGIFFPQNKTVTSTTDLAFEIAAANGKKLRTTKLFNPIIRLLSYGVDLVNKAFGNLTYDPALSLYDVDYASFSLHESIQRTEEGSQQAAD